MPVPTGHAAPLPYPPPADLPGDPLQLAGDLTGAWGYQLDTPQIAYGRGPWPYHRHGKPATVRLSPDIAHRAWQTHYVIAGPAGDDQAYLILTCHDSADGNRPARVYASLDLSGRRIVLPKDLPMRLIPQAIGKAKKVLQLLDAARADRAIHARPVTADMRALARLAPITR
ncbi:hypothetical protein [Catellatospora bangladeshensis]|nr:hypothetical protein [Catellatospora bangladeshensis]